MNERISKICTKCNQPFTTSEDYDTCSYCWVEKLTSFKKYIKSKLFNRLADKYLKKGL